MDVKECLWELGREHLGELLVDIDFFGPLEGEDMIGEFVVRDSVTPENLDERVDLISTAAEKQGWRVCLAWVMDGRPSPASASAP